jgi:hypothetical protein
MQRQLASILFLVGGCKIHRIPEVPPEQDPAAEQAPAVPYRPPPDVLTKELSTGESTASGHEGHEGHDMKGHDMKGHEGHDMKAPEKKKKSTSHEHHHGGEP